MLSITKSCNLDCAYCYQTSKSDTTMSLDMAKAILTKQIQHADGFDEIHVDLTGGEVFMEFQRVKEICEWAWSIPWPKPILFFASSNGTLVHGEIKAWLLKNRSRFWVGISVDGTREMHNRNRSQSYDDIDFDFFVKTWPSQTVKMTVSPESLPSLTEGIVALHGLGFGVLANFAYLCDWSDPNNETVLKRELRSLADYYLDHPGVKVSAMLDIPLHLMFKKHNDPVKWCGTGTHMVSIDSQGNEYPCHFFMPGTMDESIPWRSFDLSDPKTLQDEECANCDLLGACPTCYGANTVQSGHPAIRDKFLCRLTKIRVVAASYLVGKKLANGTLKIANRRVLNDTVLAIKRLQDSIS
jgi:radical SAM protein with 4Fe4S-binding SPASM domain